MNTTVTPNFDKTVDAAEFKFRFKKDKNEFQRPTVELKGFVPSVEGIVAILEAGGKGLDLLKEAMYDVVRDAVGSYVADNEAASQDNMPWEKFTWEAIANAPREDRRTIAKEVWEAFGADYLAVMPGVTNKSAEAVGNAVQVYLKKFSIIKTNKPILAKLKEQLGLYMEHSPKAGDFTEVLDVLNKKLDLYLNSNETEQLISNL